MYVPTFSPHKTFILTKPLFFFLHANPYTVAADCAGPYAAAAASQTAKVGGGHNTVVTSDATFTTSLKQGTTGGAIGKVELTDSGIAVSSADDKPVTVTAGGNLVMSSTNGNDVSITSADDFTVATTVGLCRLNQVDPYPITYSLSNP